MNIPFLSRLFKSRDKPKDYYAGTDMRYLFGMSSSGKSVTEFTAMQTTAVYACVRILAETLAALPLQMYRYKGQDTEVPAERDCKAVPHPATHERQVIRADDGYEALLEVTVEPVPAGFGRIIYKGYTLIVE